MKLTPLNTQVLNTYRAMKAAHLEYCEKVIAEIGDLEHLSKEEFESAKIAIVAIRKYFIDPVKLSERVEPGQEVGKTQEDFG